MALSSDVVECEEPGADDPQALCGAQAATHGRCLAHLSAEGRRAYLATLSPGADVHLRGATIPDGLLAELLNALRDDHGDVQTGLADFSGVTFSGDVDFLTVTFSPTPKT
ncbi:hypothetical protein [Actinomadura sp. HBU206391]|uniref:hypothetical protein n=1 Tax=Actinomadura sp. HBU206391 TaxID=2731692 RepID=UPI00165024EF|nr:hypothetical protein [Actinomadura sp. HBU206391]MBC6460275.1 hypothetical protein [Actinomadura sp. HBU206391]